jgi:8-oxo-dGTP pyrophosphatase MutT (NUDIX family)
LTRPRTEPPRLIVVGVDVLGAEVVSLVLGHGDDPVTLLAVNGWQVQRARDVKSVAGGTQVLTMSFVVEPVVVAQLQLGVPLHRDEELVTIEGEVPQPYQRVAAYAYVTSSRGVLMTQFSDRTNAAGQWGLPGGGLEAAEAPDRAVVREAWEESGQVIEVSALAHIQTTRWIGRAPTGRLEDFHAVRLVYRASCHAPTEPVVYDVGGTTASAAWVQPSDLDRLDVASSWRSLMSEVVMAPDQADGPEHHEQETDAHDCARPQL